MFDRLFGTKEQDPAIAERIPPGQYKTDKFPVLHYGSVPHTTSRRGTSRSGARSTRRSP